MNMNAKTEFLKEVEGKQIKCAYIREEKWYINKEDEIKKYILKCNYTDDEYKVFLDELNFEYDSGYGSQKLYGNVWFEDGTWLERGEYDGSEWWEHKACPEIRKECLV